MDLPMAVDPAILHDPAPATAHSLMSFLDQFFDLLYCEEPRLQVRACK